MSALSLPWLYLVSAFGLGALHALEPGHGKALVASFLLQKNGRLSDAFLLGLVVAVCHTLSVVGIAIAGFWTAQAFTANTQQAAAVLHFISGLLVMMLGAMMLWRQFKPCPETQQGCAHAHHHHDLEGKLPESATEPALKPMSYWEVITLGVASGLSPCPVALTAALLALSYSDLTHWGRIFGFVAVFSIGLGAVICGIALMTMTSKSWLSHKIAHWQQKKPGATKALRRLKVGLGWLLGWVVLGVGLLMAFSPTPEHLPSAYEALMLNRFVN